MKYVVLDNEVTSDYVWQIHAVGCADIAKAKRKQWRATTEEFDLGDHDDVMAVLDGDDLGYSINDVKIFPCAEVEHGRQRSAKVASVDVKRRTAKKTTVPPAKPARPAATKPAVPTTKPKANGAAVDAANAKAEQIMVQLIEKIVARRGTDDVGSDDRWADDRLPSCDDYAYDLAVEVRKARGAGTAWWRIAYDMDLPHAGPSAKQGKGGAAFARRLWTKAWGATYETGERVKRDTKAAQRERAAVVERRPVFTDAAKEAAIITAVCGQQIHWTARVDTPGGAVFSPQTAIVHDDPRTIKIVLGPRGRVLEFFECLDASMLKIDPHRAIAKTGPRRSLYVSHIEKVGA